MLAVHVLIQVKPGYEARFMAASCENARCSLQEPGVVRFDLVQQQDDPSCFVLVEVYRDAAAAAAHKETAHYACWRDAVADWMAVPRRSVKYQTCFPQAESGWRSL
jgi:quinol monooxygenase YgiN